MTQNREIPRAEHRTGEDFEWVNHWAASGAASRRYSRAPTVAERSQAVTEPVRPQAIAERSQAIAEREDQLHRDMAEIAAARDALIAQAIAERSPEQTTSFRVPAALTGRPAAVRPRNRDSVPILVGGLLATILLVAFGAVASIMQLGR